jgi:predicted transcriptional regulator
MNKEEEIKPKNQKKRSLKPLYRLTIGYVKYKKYNKIHCDLINKITKRRHELGMTIIEFKKKANLLQNYYNNITTGTTSPRLNTFIDMCEALDYEIVIRRKLNNSMKKINNKEEESKNNFEIL